ncbi:MAG: undecaprenyl/decaprenyl-phosphate alpha-N-acetylglucosaminyl 1-phosphate transferase [Chitinophagaceae bacterium]|nr:undecaprenyl/decaprenyl-phosphate alpha-N-acetylglucosaminyl 1-phosphate transferase [Chitinophagaceae bacterium]
MFDILLSVIISFSLTFLAIPIIITVAERKKLYDIPDARKIHIAPIASLGGFGIFAGFIISSLITIPFTTGGEFQYFMAAAFVIFFLGLKDDILIISPIKKFIGQVLAAFLIIYKGGIQITSMHGFLGIYEIPEMFSLLLTYFAVLVVINSFNLIDGVDGLAGSLGLMASVVFGFYFLKIEAIPYATLSFSLAGSLIAFLIFNFDPARIFMGDTGSLLIGLLTSILVIKFINLGASPNVLLPLQASPALGFVVLMVPLLDTLRVFAIRILNRRSPFSPDRNHVHHLLLDRGLSHRSITLILTGVNLLFIALAFSLRSLGCNVIIFSMVGIFFTAIAILYFTKRKPRLFVATNPSLPPNSDGKTPSKLISLPNDAAIGSK